MALKTYNAKKVAVICGSFNLSGFNDGDFVSVEYNEDAWTLQKGADGESARSKSNNYSAKIKVTCMQTSSANQILQDFFNSDKLSDAGVFPFTVKDNSGKSLHFAQQAWVMKQPVAALGKAPGTREWTIETDEMTSNEGGN